MAKISEKLVCIAENVQKVYDAGFEAGKAEGGDTTEAYNNGYADGQKAEYDMFWDNFQDNGKRSNYSFAFAGVGWTDDNFKPKYKLNIYGSATYLFNNCSNITRITYPIKIKSDSSIKASNVFATCSKLKEISSLEVKDNVTSFAGWFGSCSELETINFTSDSVIANTLDIHWSTKLSADSIKNIIDHLGGSASATLTLPTTAEENYDAVYGSGAFNTLVASRPSNWTIKTL